MMLLSPFSGGSTMRFSVLFEFFHGGYMWRMASIVAALAATLTAGCAQIPPSAQETQAKQFGAIVDKAVIYIVRPGLDSSNTGTLNLGDAGTITTHPRTFYRWEVAPGTHRITTFGAGTAAVTVRAEAGKIYFVQHVVHGDIRHGVTSAHLQRIDDSYGRTLVQRAQLL
jgi:hypothetical protein